MGLPVFREPTTTDSKPAAKSVPDPTAHSRSSIRRQSTARAARRQPPGLRRSPPLNPQTTRSYTYVPPLPPIPHVPAWEHIDEDSRTVERQQRAMMLGLHDRARSRDNGRRPRSARGTFRVSDATETPSLEQRRPMMSATVRSTQRNEHHDLTGNTTVESSRVGDVPDVVSVVLGSPDSMIEAAGFRPESDHEAEGRYPDLTQAHSALDELPPLRRMGHRSITDIANTPRRSQVDGLGDRRRSWSPESEADQWETLLSTITPDPSLPSADSSFASAAASFPGHNTRNGDNTVTSQTSSTRPTRLRSSVTTLAPPQLPSPPTQDDGFDEQYCDDEDHPIYGTDSDPDATLRRLPPLRRRRSRSSARVTFNQSSAPASHMPQSPSTSTSRAPSVPMSMTYTHASSHLAADIDGFLTAVMDGDESSLHGTDYTHDSNSDGDTIEVSLDGNHVAANNGSLIDLHNQEDTGAGELEDRHSSLWSDIDPATRDHMRLHLANLAQREDVPESWFHSAGLMRLRERRARRERRRMAQGGADSLSERMSEYPNRQMWPRQQEMS